MKKYNDEIEFDFEDEDENIDSDEFDFPENYMSTKDEDDEFQNKLRLLNLKKNLNLNIPSSSEKWKEEKPYSPIKSNDLPLEKYLEKKKTMKLKEADISRIVKKVLQEQLDETSNYMFFSNLEQIKRQCEKLLELDPKVVDDILNNGHDWADDHVTEAKTNMDQVFDFLMNETRKQKSYIDFEDIHEGRKKAGTKLCARGKAAAKAKYKVWPSAYGNGFAVQVCQGKIKGLDGKKHCSGAYC